MATALPEKKEEDNDVIIDMTEKGWFNKITQGVQEEKKKGMAKASYSFLLKHPEENFT